MDGWMDGWMDRWMSLKRHCGVFLPPLAVIIDFYCFLVFIRENGGEVEEELRMDGWTDGWMDG